LPPPAPSPQYSGKSAEQSGILGNKEINTEILTLKRKEKAKIVQLFELFNKTKLPIYLH